MFWPCREHKCCGIPDERLDGAVGKHGGDGRSEFPHEPLHWIPHPGPSVEHVVELGSQMWRQIGSLAKRRDAGVSIDAEARFLLFCQRPAPHIREYDGTLQLGTAAPSTGQRILKRGPSAEIGVLPGMERGSAGVVRSVRAVAPSAGLPRGLGG